jgi:Reverse transcriptase (RNA-dependent DNA polymerase)
LAETTESEHGIILTEIDTTSIGPANTATSTNLKPNFTESRRKELNGLIEKGCFAIVKESEVPLGLRIFNSRFVDEIKHQGTDKAFEKSRLVVQAYNDPGKSFILTQAPTIQRVSQRLILSIATSMGSVADLYLRDISQAYIQSTTEVNRDFYVRAPREMELPKGAILKILRPLYGIPEAGAHWFNTYHSHHIQRLHLTPSTYDPCLLYAKGTVTAIVGLQTDDTLFLADDNFAELEQKELDLAGFLAKPREKLTQDSPIKFNGGIITLNKSGSIAITQERQCNNLSLIDQEPTILKTRDSERLGDLKD